MCNYSPSYIDPAARALIRHKVSRLIGRHGFTASDREDLEQELALQAHIAAAKYDPTRGSPTAFYATVLTNKVKSVVAAAKAQKRDHRLRRPLCDLDDIVQQPDSTPALCLHLDVDAACESLSVSDRSVATLFITHNLAEVARTTGMTRGKARSARSRIARHFAGHGLKE